MDISKVERRSLRLEGTPEENEEMERLAKLRNALWEEDKFYEQENAKLEGQLKQLNLLPHQLNAQAQAALEKLVRLQEHYQSKECTAIAIGLSHVEMLRKQNNYKSKIQNCIAICNSLNNKLCKKIKLAKETVKKEDKGNVLVDVLNECKLLEVKLEKYEMELLKFENKHQWINDSKYKIENITKEMDSLNMLRDEKERLLKELNVYQGLKPNIYEAKKQLNQIKLQYELEVPKF